MKSSIIFAAGAVAMMFDECKEATERRREQVEQIAAADIVEPLLMIPANDADAPIPSPDTHMGDWEEFRSFLKTHTGLSIAQVCGDNSLMYIIVQGDLPFSVCKSRPDVWLPLVQSSSENKHLQAQLAYQDLISRIR